MNDVEEPAGVKVQNVEGSEECFAGTRFSQVVLYVFLAIFDLI